MYVLLFWSFSVVLSFRVCERSLSSWSCNKLRADRRHKPTQIQQKPERQRRRTVGNHSWSRFQRTPADRPSYLVEERQEVSDAADFLQDFFKVGHFARRDVPDVDQTRSVFAHALWWRQRGQRHVTSAVKPTETTGSETLDEWFFKELSFYWAIRKLGVTYDRC